MTPHPIDPEEARFGAEAHLRYGGGGDDLAENVLALLDALAAAEQRATRAEEKIPEEKALRMKAVAAVTETEADRDEWRQTALEERAGLLDTLDQLKARDTRIQAALMILDEDTRWQDGEHLLARIREALTAAGKEPTT